VPRDMGTWIAEMEVAYGQESGMGSLGTMGGEDGSGITRYACLCRLGLSIRITHIFLNACVFL